MKNKTFNVIITILILLNAVMLCFTTPHIQKCFSGRFHETQVSKKSYDSEALTEYLISSRKYGYVQIFNVVKDSGKSIEVYVPSQETKKLFLKQIEEDGLDSSLFEILVGTWIYQ